MLPPPSSIRFLQRGVNLSSCRCFNVDEVFCQRDLTTCRSQVSSGSFSLHKERCVELCCAASITNNRTTGLRTRGVLCCFYEISHLCAYLESRITLRYGGVQHPKYINICDPLREKGDFRAKIRN